MFGSRFLKQAADRTTTNATSTRRSKLFSRRATRYTPIVPAQPPSDIADDTVAPDIPVAPETATSVPLAKPAKRGKKPEKSLPCAPRQKSSRRKKSSVEGRDAGMAAIPQDQLAFFPKS